MRVYAKENIRDNAGKIVERRYWKLNLTQYLTRKLDNGALISCGLTFGTGKYPAAPDELSNRQLQRIVTKEQVTEEQYKHSSCQSYCVLRGHDKCGW